MRIVVCGAGLVGRGIARRLSREGHIVTIIDQTAKLIDEISTELDVIGVTGYASYPEILQSAGAEHADMVIAVTYSDEVNMIVCQIAHSLFSTPVKIARIRSQAYLDPAWRNMFARDDLPIDMVISPEIEVGKSILQQLDIPGAFFSTDFADGRVKVLGVDVHTKNPLIDTALDQIETLFPDLGARIVGIGRGNKLFAPRANDRLYAKDRAYITIRASATDRLISIIGDDTQVRRIIIVGGGNVGLYVAKQLEARKDYRVRVIERNLARAEVAARQLKRAIVVHGDGLSSEVLEECGVDSADMILGLTNDDRINLLLSPIAKRLNAKRTLALINDAEYLHVRDNVELDVVVDPRAVTVSQILLHLRRGRIISLQSLEDGAAEIAEGVVTEVSPLVGEQVGYDALPEGIALGALVRRDQVLVMNNETRLREKDHAILFFERSMRKKVEQMFRVSPEFF